jgi:aerobic-type carbon monoxide dehydrogenase small subunit (CoxS/CutS family)
VNKTILLEINGRQKEIQVDVRQSLLEVLREKLGLTGVKQGCAVGECGACTVLLDGEPIDACLFLAVWADGHSIRTVEGESRDGKLSKVQQAFVEEGAVQCGICTPGFVMAATALVEKHGDAPPDRHRIRLGMAGNLCRCTGYETIVTAVEKSIRDKKEKNR